MQRDQLKSLDRRLPYAVLVVVMMFMTWVRLLPRDQAIEDGRVFFTANDPWYHIRVNEYLVEHYPAVMPADVFTNFPFGTLQHTGFGGLFNQITVFVAMVVGLGDPSQYQLELVTALAPVGFGVATAIPVYLVARELTDQVYGLMAVVSLALITGQFLNRTTFGNAQHQSAEAFFMALAVFGLIYAVHRAYTEKPTVAHIRDRDWQGLKPAAVGSLVGGICLGLYILTWPAGIFVVVPFGVFVTLQMVREHLKGESTEYLALTLAGSFLVSATMSLVYVSMLGLHIRFSGTSFSLLGPVVLFGTGVGILTLHGISWYIRKKDYGKSSYPVAVVGLVLMGVVFLWAAGQISLLRRLIGNIYGFGYFKTGGAATVAEVTPASPGQAIADNGLLWIFGFFALAWMVYRVVTRDRPIELLTLFWALTMYSAYFTQGRFGYYMALAVSVLTAYGIYHAVRLLDVDDLEFDVSSFQDLGDSILDVKGYQAIGLIMILFIFLPVLMIGLGPGVAPAWDSVRAGGDEPWQQDSLAWMQNNTPEPGVDYLAEQPIPEGGDFDYPVDESPIQGAYGVMSWWDYGHWITVNAKRVPMANPFQEGNYIASAYLTSQTEEKGNLLLEALPSLEPDPGRNVVNYTDDELQGIIEDQGSQERYEDTRYVMIDDQMAGDKFGAIATWVGFEQDEWIGNSEVQLGEDNESNEMLPTLSDGYDDTTLSRLYFDDARHMETYRLVHETETYSLMGWRLSSQGGVGQFSVLNRLGYDEDVGLGVPVGQLSFPPDQAISDGQEGYLYELRSEASVKTYERVPGAEISGTSNHSDENVTVALELQTDNTGRQFYYAQDTKTDEDGSFSFRVPYASEHDLGVDDGATESAVEPQGDYEVYVGNVGLAQAAGQEQLVGETLENGTVEVTESALYDGEEAEVELQDDEGTIGISPDDGEDEVGDGDVDDSGEVPEDDADGGVEDGADEPAP